MNRKLILIMLLAMLILLAGSSLAYSQFRFGVSGGLGVALLNEATGTGLTPNLQLSAHYNIYCFHYLGLELVSHIPFVTDHLLLSYVYHFNFLSYALYGSLGGGIGRSTAGLYIVSELTLGWAYVLCGVHHFSFNTSIQFSPPATGRGLVLALNLSYIMVL
jgi:hypothetical protein